MSTVHIKSPTEFQTLLSSSRIVVADCKHHLVRPKPLHPCSFLAQMAPMMPLEILHGRSFAVFRPLICVYLGAPLGSHSATYFTSQRLALTC
ncbi:hypothetical protein LZ32DRAFT_365 [Colletotrichum eremochloae]|nr:hypothetical protein LZ32DRAFT_365 [Colletotrichum eremochloae]